MTRERIIFDNRSSKPLYESLNKAYDLYFEEWDDDFRSLEATWKDLKFIIKKNKESITIVIQDYE